MPRSTTYSIGQVAELSGVSVRTLRHYEELGLITPARSQNGYRTYTHEDIRRLQHILLYRECGMELTAIGRSLDDPDFDERAALDSHLHVLLARKEEVDRLIGTVRKTIDSLEGDSKMTDAERFEGLKRETIEQNEATFGAEARELYGDAAVDAANESLLSMGEKEWTDREELESAIIDALSEAMREGDPAGARAHEMSRMHEQWIRMHWGDAAYSPEAHLGLAQGYLADQRFVDYYDSSAGEGATQFLVAALEHYLMP